MMRSMRRSLLTVAGAITLVLLAAAPAWADAATPTNYRSQIIYVEGPGVVEVEIVGGDAFVRLAAEPGAVSRSGHDPFMRVVNDSGIAHQ